jgi:hypothetical protein
MDEEDKEKNQEEISKPQQEEDVKKEDKLPTNKEDKKSLIQSAREAAAELRKANEERAKQLKEEKEILERKEALAELGGDSIKETEKKEDEEVTPERIQKDMSKIGW